MYLKGFAKLTTEIVQQGPPECFRTPSPCTLVDHRGKKIGTVLEFPMIYHKVSKYHFQDEQEAILH